MVPVRRLPPHGSAPPRCLSEPENPSEHHARPPGARGAAVFHFRQDACSHDSLIFVTGGVVSSLGKGIAAASLAPFLKPVA